MNMIMEKICNVYSNGNSLVITIPKDVVDYLDLQKGCRVKVEFIREV